MAKFSIPEEEFLITRPVQDKKSAELENKEADKPQVVEENPKYQEVSELRPAVNKQSQALVDTEVNEGDYVKVRVGRVQKKETMSEKKMVLMKPSVVARLDRVLKTKLEGTSFNSVVNQLIEGWLDEVDTIDSEE